MALDADSEFQRTVVELREAVAGRIETADGLGALRAALTGTFEAVYLNRGPSAKFVNLLPGEMILAPNLRFEAIIQTKLPEPWDITVETARPITLQIRSNDNENKDDANRG